MFLLKWLLSVKNIRHLKNLLNFTVPKYVTCRSRPYDQKNFTWEAELISGTTIGTSTRHPPSSGRACSQAHSSFSSPEPVVSCSRGRLQIKPSGSGDENGQSFLFFFIISVQQFFSQKNLLQNFLQTSMYIMLLESESVRKCAAWFPARTYSREEGRVATPDCVTLARLRPERLRRRLLTLEANGKTGRASRRRNRAAITIPSHHKSFSSTRNFQTSYDY